MNTEQWDKARRSERWAVQENTHRTAWDVIEESTGRIVATFGSKDHASIAVTAHNGSLVSSTNQ